MKLAVISVTSDFTKIISASPWLSTIFALFVTALSSLYGTKEVTQAGMSLIIILITIDWITGFSAAAKDKIDTSSYGIEGLCRSVVLLLLPAMGHFLDKFFYTPGIIQYFIIAALARHLLKSSIANTYRVGWAQWIPTDVLEKIVSWVSDEIAHKTARARQRFNQIHDTNKEE